MKVKELIGLLQKFDPEAKLNFEVGFASKYRETCAKLILEDKQDGDGCLQFMDVTRIDQELDVNDEISDVNIHLIQSYYKDEYFDECLRKVCEKSKK